jgi:signal peptidase I
MRSVSASKLLASGLGLAAIVCVWFYIAPVGLGGSTSYVVTHGISMEPRFHAGDLALVRPKSDYRVGEIVAYNSRVFHTVVLHRIIARDGDRYVFKGDNNNFVDFEHPARSQLIGALWLHLPGAGAPLESLRSPALTGGLVGLGTLLLLGAAVGRKRTRRRRRERRGDNVARPRGDGRQPDFMLLGAGLVALLPFLALALLSFTRSTSVEAPVSVPYSQSGHLSYSADATPGPAYAGNRAVTGQPLFTHVLDKVAVGFDYRFRSTAASSLAGSVALQARVTSSNGWQTSFPIGRPESFSGSRASATGTLDLGKLVDLMDEVEKTTAVNGSYTLSVEPRVNVGGRLAEVPLHATFGPKMLFSLSALEARPLSSSGSAYVQGQSVGSPFAPTASASLAGKHSQPQRLSFGLFRLAVHTARPIAIGGIALTICVLWALMAFGREPRRDELEEILARYGRLVVEVEHVWQLAGVPVIDVADIDALARIAEHYDRSILHESSGQGDAFWVTDESGQFRYQLAELSGEQPAETASPAFEEPVTAVHTAVQPTAFEVGVEAHWAAYQLASAIAAEAPEWGPAEAVADISPLDW